MTENQDPIQELLRRCAVSQPGLRLLVLFGSRGRGDAREDSDWDFGYQGGPGFEPDSLLLELVRVLGTDHVDLVDLDRANGVLRYRAARDGRVVFETPEAFRRFWLEAVDFWCDVEPILRPHYEALLEELPKP